LSSANILRTRGVGGSSDADVRTFWHKKLRIFEIYDVSAWTKGVEPVRTFCEQEEGVNFVRTFLWTAPYDKSLQLLSA